MTIGNRIKNRRIELNMTQDELARKCGYKSRSSVNKIELSRELPLRKIEVMARALDCSPSYLMGWEDEAKAIIAKADWLEMGLSILEWHENELLRNESTHETTLEKGNLSLRVRADELESITNRLLSFLSDMLTGTTRANDAPPRHSEDETLLLQGFDAASPDEKRIILSIARDALGRKKGRLGTSFTSSAKEVMA